jgi:murein DD-endopeptidase MepM/ murein hydrolase activator NlpD
MEKSCFTGSSDMERTKEVAVRAVRLYAERRFAEAVELCEREMKRTGPTPALRVELSRALIALHRTEEAERQLALCVRENPECAPAYRMLGEIAFQQNRLGRAREYAEVAARIAPSDNSTAILLQVVRSAAGGGRARVSAPVEHPKPEREPSRLFLVRDSDSPPRDDETRVVSRDSIEAQPSREAIEANPSQASIPSLYSQRSRFGLSHVLAIVAVLTAGGVLLVPRLLPVPPALLAASTSAIEKSQEPAPATPAPTKAEPPAEPDVDWTAEIAADTWMHPLSGPLRRMPVRSTRIFGAERPGDRPVECKSGHCGVDLGEQWGEPVLAAHSGVIDRVQRLPNPDHGGHYVRIAHRKGTVFTQYFHLAAIPRNLEKGVQVKAGQVIGILGDTGVVESGPHLHFTVSVKPTKKDVEHYIDPEPLIALWPLHVNEVGGANALRASLPPGVPFRSKVDKRRKSAPPDSTD